MKIYLGGLMENLLEDFSWMYEQQIAQEIYKGDETRTIRNPILFVFIGDESKEALSHIQQEVLEKWKNGEGMLFLQIAQNIGQKEEGIYYFESSSPKDKDSKYRQNLHHIFYKDSKKLLELNQTIGKIRNQISTVGSLYATCEKVHICIISHVTDPLNILVQDIGVLLKNKLGETFKQVTMDFYGLIQEQEEDNYSLNCAISMSFFRELEYMQSKDFAFKGNLEVLERDIVIEIAEDGGPLFNLNYLLSNKNEHGILSKKHMENNYRMIAAMNVLKNRYDSKAYNETNNQIYNDGKFKQQLIASGSRNLYVSLGFGRIQRPNQRIAFTVLHHFYNYILEKIKTKGIENERLYKQNFGYDRISLGRKASTIVPDKEGLEDMQGILSANIRSGDAANQSFRELEYNLYADVAQGFFRDNFEKVAMDTLETYMDNEDPENEQMFFWSEKGSEKSILLELHGIERILTQDLANLEANLDELYSRTINMQGLRMVPLAEKANMRRIKKLFFSTIYQKKLEILILKVQIKLANIYETKIQEIYEKSTRQVELLNEIGDLIYKGVLLYEKNQDEYLEKNIEKYYKKVVDELLQTMEKQRVEDSYFDERFLGSPHALLDEGKEEFIKRLIKVCEQHILSDKVFKKSFEEELLSRANIAVKYGEQGTLTKQDLFEKLYLTLGDTSSINIYTYRYTQKNPYEEKYYFGDYYSDLMQYILNAEKQGAQLSVGCIHEKRTSGIELVRIMGGFHLEDLIYIKACKKYYNLYLKEGYLFHAVGQEKLPDVGINN